MLRGCVRLSAERYSIWSSTGGPKLIRSLPSAPICESPEKGSFILPGDTCWCMATSARRGASKGLRVVRSIQPGTDQALLASLSGWEFRAATKDGVGVMVEFLLSIPAKGL